MRYRRVQPGIKENHVCGRVRGDLSAIIHGWPAFLPDQFAGVFVPAPGAVRQAMFAVAFGATLRRAACREHCGVIAILADLFLGVASEAERRHPALGIHMFRRGNIVFISAVFGRLNGSFYAPENIMPDIASSGLRTVQREGAHRSLACRLQRHRASQPGTPAPTAVPSTAARRKGENGP